MPFAKNEQTSIWYTDQGDGQPVLLIHGGLLDPMNGERFWERPGVVQDLTALGYRVLVPDRRYSVGRTTTLFSVYSWESEAADFAAILHTAGITSAAFVAGSNGCSAAIRFAVTYPALVRSLVLCWPVSLDNAGYQQAFELSAKLIEQIGPASYLSTALHEALQ